MNRRTFNKRSAMAAIGLGIRRMGRASTRSAAPQFAITMDDFHWRDAVHLTAEQRNAAILGVLRVNRVKAALFAVGANVDDRDGLSLLRTWDDARHIIGNHTYSHRSLSSSITVDEYEADILRAESLLKKFRQFRRIFRYPALKEGNTEAKRDLVRTFLKDHNYRVGHVTIDNSDWFIDQRLTARMKTDPQAELKPYRDYYLEHMWDRAQYYDRLARTVMGRAVKHTILMHFNLLNGLFLGELVQMFRNKGWQLIDAEDAFTDPIFRSQPKILPAGESIVWALAKEQGTVAASLRYPAEDGEYEKAKMDRLGL